MKINVKAQSNRCFRGISIGVFVAFQSVFSWHMVAGTFSTNPKKHAK